jgi:hypothetical protein
MYGFAPIQTLKKGKPYDVYLLGCVLYELVTLDQYNPNEECCYDKVDKDVSSQLVSLGYWMLNKV